MLDLGLRIVDLIMILVSELQWTASAPLFVHSFPGKCCLFAQVTLSVDDKCIRRFLHLAHFLSGAHNRGSWKLKFNERVGWSMIEGRNIEMCTIRYSTHKLLSEMIKMPFALTFTLVLFSEIISLAVAPQERIDFAGFPLWFFQLHCNSMIVFELLNPSLHNKAQKPSVGF